MPAAPQCTSCCPKYKIAQRRHDHDHRKKQAYDHICVSMRYRIINSEKREGAGGGHNTTKTVAHLLQQSPHKGISRPWIAHQRLPQSQQYRATRVEVERRIFQGVSSKIHGKTKEGIRGNSMVLSVICACKTLHTKALDHYHYSYAHRPPIPSSLEP